MKKPYVAMILFGGLSLAGAEAATISWTKSAITSNVSEVVTTGTSVEAYNTTSGAQVTANPTLTFAGTTFTSVSNRLNNDFNTDSWSATVTGGTTAENAAYQSFLDYLDYSGNQGTSSLFTIQNFTGLTVGQEYLLQVWYAAEGVTRTMTLGGDAATAGSNVLSVGEYAIGTFTADATTQTLQMQSSQSGVRLTGYQLRLIPEPSATAMFGLGLGALVLRRRRVG